jgi:sugar/nucleoside kinase (ribokinase family)
VDPASEGFLRELGTETFLGLLGGVDVLVPNRAEACLLTGQADPAAAAARLSRMFPLVAATLGSEGALVAWDGAVLGRVPAVPARARDSTGAGDAFTGAFLAALLAGADAVGAAQAGCRAGALAVGRVGGRPPLRGTGTPAGLWTPGADLRPEPH